MKRTTEINVIMHNLKAFRTQITEQKDLLRNEYYKGEKSMRWYASKAGQEELCKIASLEEILRQFETLEASIGNTFKK